MIITMSLASVAPHTVEDHYRRIYYESLDYVLGSIKDRFEQKGFKILQKLESVLLFTGETPESQGSDINKSRLRTQLTILHSSCKEPLKTLQGVMEYISLLSAAQKEFYGEVIKVLKLILVMPATNVISERSFSALKRLKTWLRTTTSQSRLNWCMILHIHKELTDQLPMRELMNEFILQNDSRRRIFGQL